MTKLGLILVCDHYPLVSECVSEIDAQLRHWLLTLGIAPDAVEVFAAYDGVLPRHAGQADAWIVSGMPLRQVGEGGDGAFALRQLLQAAVSVRCPVLALNHGEHVVHAALAAVDVPPPATTPHIRAIRNPFRSFLGRDTLHRFDPLTRRVEALERPATLCPRALFGSLRAAAHARPALRRPET